MLIKKISLVIATTFALVTLFGAKPFGPTDTVSVLDQGDTQLLQLKTINDNAYTRGDSTTDVDRVLLKVQEKLMGLKTVRYIQTREMRYFGDNYDSRQTFDMYIHFSGEGPLGLRFQGRSDKSSFIYADTVTMRTDDESMTIQSGKVTAAKDLESNSFLYNSLVTLRNMIPVIISGNGINKSLSDTLIGKQRYFNVRFSAPGKYFTGSGGTVAITPQDPAHQYNLIVDKTTFFPYQFVNRFIRQADSRDYIRVTYTAINAKPAAPTAASWTYAEYSAKYRPFKAPVKVSLVKTGSVIPDFTLPEYSTTGTSSTPLSKYSGKIILIDFWFKSCGPCMEAMPHYNTLQSKYGQSNFQLLTVNVEDPVADIQFFYNKYQPNYPMLFNGKKLWSGLGFTGCPSSVLLDKTGKVAAVFFGFDADTVGKQVERLIAEN